MKKFFPPAFLLILAAAVWFFIWRVNTPVGDVVNWDFFHHAVAINNLARGNVSLILTQISDTFTFNSYTPLFYLPFALIRRLTGIDTLALLWWGELVHFLLTVLVSWWIGRKILGRFGGFLTGLFGIFVFESNTVYAGLFLLPQTAAALLGSAILAWVITAQQRRPAWWKLALLSGVVLATHFIIGAAFLVCLLTVFLLRAGNISFSRSRTLLLLGPLVLLAISLFLGQTTQFLVPNRLDAADFVFNTATKLKFFYQWFGLLPWLFLPVGIVSLWRRRQESADLTLFLSLILLAMAFFPLSYGLKFYVLGRYFLNVVLAAGLLALVRNFRSIAVQGALVLIVGLALGSNLLVNMLSTLQASFNGQTNSFISPADHQATTWLKSHYDGPQTFLISDPETQAVFEAAAEVNTQGGAFPRPDTVVALDSLARETNPDIFAAQLLTIHDTLPLQDSRTKTLVNLGGRYFVWQRFSAAQKLSSFFQVWTPQKLAENDLAFIKKLSSSSRFRLVYQDDENAILEIR